MSVRKSRRLPMPSFHAFTYTETGEAGVGEFVVAGSGEAPEGKGNYRDHVIRPGDVSPVGLREKARYVLGEMERRMGALGFAMEGCKRGAGLYRARPSSLSCR